MVLRIKAVVLHGLVMLVLSSASSLAAQGSQDETLQQYSQAGQQALAAGHYDEAESDFKKLLAIDPDIAEIHATLGLVYFQEKKFDQAVPELRRALRLKPGLTRASTLLAMSLSEVGEYPEALPGLEKGFQQAPDPDTKRLCGLQLMRAYTGLQRDRDAVTVALELNRLYPNDPEILYHTGRIYGNFRLSSRCTSWKQWRQRRYGATRLSPKRSRARDRPTSQLANIARCLNSILIVSKFITASAGRCWRAGNLLTYPKTERRQRGSLSRSCSWIRAMPTPSTSWPRSIAK
jgi:tetratricopeptide (TPR) repeat protein